MKILHVCLAAFYIDNYSYQENILPLEHKKMGFDVEILASTETFIDNNKLGYVEPREYLNEYNIKVTRIPYSRKIPHKINIKIRKYVSVTKFLEKSKPDIVFFHDLQFFNVKEFVRYFKKNPKVIALADSHTDFSNSAQSFISKNILHKIIYKKYVMSIDKYIQHYYGVLPARCEFLHKVYGVQKEKISLLVMGAEENRISIANESIVKEETIKKYKLEKYSKIFVTGGKIDSAKLQVFDLIEAFRNLENKGDTVLVIFGSVASEIKEKFFSSINHNNIKYIPWLNVQESYNLFAISDLVIFPGRHSIYWEQVAGCGIPLLVKKWDGTTHVNIHDNALFLEEGTVEEMIQKIKLILFNLDFYKENAKKAANNFSYTNIARKSLEKAEDF